MPRLYTKEAAIAAGVHVSTGKDVIDAVNELHATVFTDDGATLEYLLARIEALENGEAPPDIPIAPVLSYSNLVFDGVRLTWTDPSSTGAFEIYNGSTLLGTSSITTADIVLVAETPYQLHVKAVSGQIRSAASNIISITTPASPVVLSAPVFDEPVVTTDSVTLTANNRPNDATVVVSFGGSDYSSTTNTVTIESLTAGTTYAFTAVYVLNGETGPISGSVVVTTLADPIEPTGGDYASVVADSVFGIDSSIIANITTDSFNRITALTDSISAAVITDLNASSNIRTLNEVNAIDIPDAGHIDLPTSLASNLTGDCSFIFAFAIDDLVRVTSLLEVINGISLTVDPVQKTVTGMFGNGTVTLTNVDIYDDVHIVVFERSGTNLNIYLDTATATASGATDVTGVTDIKLVPDFNGALAEFLVVPRALTNDEKIDLGVAA